VSAGATEKQELQWPHLLVSVIVLNVARFDADHAELRHFMSSVPAEADQGG